MDYNKLKPFLIGLVVVLALAAAYGTVVRINGQRLGMKKQAGNISGMGGDYVGSPEISDAVGVAVPGQMGLKRGVVGSAPMMDQSFATSAIAPDTSQVADQKVIKNGSLNMKVSNLDAATENINKIAKENGGEVFSSNFYNTGANLKSGWVTVKVPVANFEKALAEIKKVASLVTQESISGQDVTEEYADLQAQIKNKQAEEQQYQAILGQAQKVQDILDVTAQLSRVRGEIESLQGRIKFLSSQADLASISINLTEDTNITVSDSWRPLQVAKDAINTLIRKSQGFVNFAIVLVITVIPIAILYLFLVYILYLIGKKIYLKVKEKKEIN